jgi:hypothetical protein
VPPYAWFLVSDCVCQFVLSLLVHTPGGDAEQLANDRSY